MEFQPRSLLSVCTFGLRVLYLSPAWEDALGRPLEELHHAAAYSLVHPDDFEDVMLAVRRLAAHDRCHRAHARLRHEDGTYRAFAWIQSAIVYQELIFAAAHPAAMHGVTRPLTHARNIARHDLTHLVARWRAGQFGSSIKRSPISTRLVADGPSSTIVAAPGALSHA